MRFNSLTLNFLNILVQNENSCNLCVYLDKAMDRENSGNQRSKLSQEIDFFKIKQSPFVPVEEEDLNMGSYLSRQIVMVSC